MKLLSNLLSQRREWKMMLLERQVHTRRWWAFPDTGNCLWKLPRAHQNCKFLFSSFAAPPPPICQWLTGGSEPRGESGRRQQGPCIRQNTQAQCAPDTHSQAAALTLSHSVPGQEGSHRRQFPQSRYLCFSGSLFL